MAAEKSSDAEPVAGEPLITPVGQTTQPRPAGRHEQPAQTDGAVGFAEHGHLLNDAAVGKNSVDDAHQFLAGRVIDRRIKPGRGDVFKCQRTAPVAALEEARLAPAERTIAIEKQFEIP